MKIYIASLLIIFCSTACQKNIHQQNSVSKNEKQHLEKPYVILISIDGYRHDYTARFQPPNISKFVQEGVQATSMLPCFPSKTFPNHYSIATGMRPENHGLVDNSFYDPAKDGIYKISDRVKVEDGSWYGGTPLWVQAAKEGMVSASYFFVGSEADIQGIRPTYWYDYDGSVQNKKRTAQVIKWLKLPEKKRPHLITMYFSDIDSRGHQVGPNNEAALTKSLLKLDEVLGDFFKELEALKLPINTLIVSDHGMEEVPIENYIPIEKLESEASYLTVNSGALAHFYLKDTTQLEEIYQTLKLKEAHFKIYKTKDAPYYKSNPDNPRIGDLIAVADHYYYFSNVRGIAMKKMSGNKTSGQHGYPLDNKDMHTIFYANGTNIKSGITIPTFENIHIYPFICELLDLEVPKNIDGKLEVLKEIIE